MTSVPKRSWAEIVGIAGVIGSLVFVGIEVSQNTAAVRGATYQAIVDASQTQTQWFAENEEIRHFKVRIAEGALMADFTAEENLLIAAEYIMTIRRIENVFVQVAERLIPEEAVLRFRPSADYFEDEYFKEFWAIYGPAIEPEFHQYFEGEFLR